MTSPIEFPPARFTPKGERVEAEMAIVLDNPRHEVWDAIISADSLAQWLAPGELQAAPDGAVRLDFVDSGIVIDSMISQFIPEQRMEYSWSRPGEPLRPVRWDLEPIGPLTRLTLTLGIPKDEDVARSTAGWAAHLEMLTAYLAGAAMKFPFPTFQAARAAYGLQLAAAAEAAEAVETAA